jgi:hypothetical protein
MVSNLLKRWRDDFATVKRQRDGFGAFGKETGCYPTPPQALVVTKSPLVKELNQGEGLAHKLPAPIPQSLCSAAVP